MAATGYRAAACKAEHCAGLASSESANSSTSVLRILSGGEMRMTLPNMPPFLTSSRFWRAASLDIKFSSSMRSITALAAAVATGLPPKVEMVAPLRDAATSGVA